MRISPRLNRIQQAVKRAEHQLVRPGQEHYIWPDGWTSFPTRGRRKPSYGATEPHRFMLMIKEVRRAGSDLLANGQHLAVLGSGVGMSSFTLADTFEGAQVTGFEIDPQLLIAAELIRQRFGVLNVEFRQADFMKADLDRFDAFYFYRPFMESYHEKMAGKLLEARPGALIMSRDIQSQPVLSSQEFQWIYPKHESYSLDLPLTDFYAYVRK